MLTSSSAVLVLVSSTITKNKGGLVYMCKIATDINVLTVYGCKHLLCMYVCKGVCMFMHQYLYYIFLCILCFRRRAYILHNQVHTFNFIYKSHSGMGENLSVFTLNIAKISNITAATVGIVVLTTLS